MNTPSNKSSTSSSASRKKHRSASSKAEARWKKKEEEDSFSEFQAKESLGSVIGSATGEADRDVLPGGWEGTDDATSTAPSDLAFNRPDGVDAENEPDKEIDRLWEEAQITGATFSEDEV